MLHTSVVSPLYHRPMPITSKGQACRVHAQHDTLLMDDCMAGRQGQTTAPMLHHLPADGPPLATVFADSSLPAIVPADSPLLATVPADSPLIAIMQRLAGANNLESLLHVQASIHADCL